MATRPVTPKSRIIISCFSVLPEEAGMTVAPTFSKPIVQAQGAGEQAVAKGDLDDVVAGDAAGGDNASHESDQLSMSSLV